MLKSNLSYPLRRISRQRLLKTFFLGLFSFLIVAFLAGVSGYFSSETVFENSESYTSSGLETISFSSSPELLNVSEPISFLNESDSLVNETLGAENNSSFSNVLGGAEIGSSILNDPFPEDAIYPGVFCYSMGSLLR